MLRLLTGIFFLTGLLFSCGKEKSAPAPVSNFSYNTLAVDGRNAGFAYSGLGLQPQIKITFNEALSRPSLAAGITLKNPAGTLIPFQSSFENDDKTILIQPLDKLEGFTTYTLSVTPALTAISQGKLKTPLSIRLTTGLDARDKFPRISDEELLTLVQKQTLTYFYDFGHPVSGLARERNTSGDLVTTGGSGFGIMALVAGVHRQLITRQQGLTRIQQLVTFLKTKADRFHGAFPHWLNGQTGKTIAFSPRDNGADLVETAFLMQGLLSARQYFSGSDPAETALRQDITQMWREVEWSWFRKGNENVLYWHWSPDQGWAMNMPIRGWNEALVVYVLAAASPTYPVGKEVYDQGWAQNGAMRNGNTFYGVNLPLGPSQGGPLFFSHYSFLGIDPRGLKDAYADYQEQTRAHTRINYQYCKANPKGYYGYSATCWGLTASDDVNGYLAHEPGNDTGVISPTAALSSLPYTPEESMAALRFFYYQLGDKIWKNYGFVDAFSLHHNWYASSFLAIDQGPIVVMIENHRSQLLWNLFMSCPEVKTGMKTLGFQSPQL